MTRRDNFLALIICLAALVPRLVAARQLGEHPLGIDANVDESTHYNWAERIGGGELIGTEPYYFDPLYPHLLAVERILIGDSIPKLRVAGAVIGTLLPLLLFYLANAAWGRVAGVLAGLAAAFYGPFVFHSALLLKESLALILFCAALLTGWAALQRPYRGCFLLWGLVSAMAALARSNLLVLAAAGAIALLARNSQGLRMTDRLRRLGTFAAGVALGIAPATTHNLCASGELIPTISSMGQNFYIGNNPRSNGSYSFPEFVRAHSLYEPLDFAAEARRQTRSSYLSAQDASRFWFHKGLSFLIENPAAATRLLIVKCLYALMNYEIPDNYDQQMVAALIVTALKWCPISFAFVLPLAVIGLFAPGRRTDWEVYLLVATGLVFLSLVAFFVVGRYRLPLVPPLMLVAGIGLVRIRLFRGRYLRIVLTSLSGLMATTVCLTPWVAPDLHFGYQRIGIACLKHDRVEEAVGYFECAAGLVGTGPRWSRVGDSDVAALSSRPGNVRLFLALQALGVSPDQMTRTLGQPPSEAYTDYEEALSILYSTATPRRPIGWLKLRTEATRLLTQATRNGHTSKIRADAETVLGLVQLANPDTRQEALRHLENAVFMRGTDRRYRLNLRYGRNELLFSRIQGVLGL